MLDPQGRREVIQTMQKLNKEEHITIINITHYMEEAVLADRIIVMDKGDIALTGTPREVFAQVDTLKKLRLDVPVVTELAQSLPAEMHLPHDILTMPLELKNVSYIYQPNTPNESTALNNVSLTINDGEFIGIIGHTGSGKSTLVQLLCGLLAPTSGQVFIDGVDINAKDTPKAERKKHRLQVGMVFQYPEHQLFEETVIADIAFGPKNLGFAEKEARALAKSAMKTVGLSADLAKSSPFDLSGGQKRRVAIAGVLAMNPKYLILDEPTAGLDPQGREEILAEVQSLRQKLGITVILVSHSMDDVARFADRLLVLNDSQLYMQGTSQEIFARAEEMRALGLDIPVVTAILKRLAQEGWDIDTSIVDLDQARAEITRAWRQKGGHKSC